jgi:hypothetical protein
MSSFMGGAGFPTVHLETLETEEITPDSVHMRRYTIRVTARAGTYRRRS